MLLLPLTLHCRQGQASCRRRANTKTKLAAAVTLPPRPSWPRLLRCPLPPRCCSKAATAAAITFDLIVVIIAVIVAISVAVAAAAFSWLLIVVCAPSITVAAGVFVATVATLPSYHPANGFVGDIRYQKSSQYHGLQNLDTRSGMEDPHSRFDFLFMRGTLLWYVGQQGV
jgi:hypothetical protein